MHSNEIKDQFAELRAKGLSLARIASDIHVSHRTLVEWNRQLAPDIRALRAVHLEALHEQTLNSRQEDLARLAKVQTNVEAAITERDFSWVDSDKLVRIYLDLRHEIRALCAADLAPLYDNPNPGAPGSPPATEPAPCGAGILPANPAKPPAPPPDTPPAPSFPAGALAPQPHHPKEVCHQNSDCEPLSRASSPNSSKTGQPDKDRGKGRDAAFHSLAASGDAPAPRGSALIDTRLQPGASAPGGLKTVSNGFPSTSPVPQPADPRANPSSLPIAPPNPPRRSPSSRQHPSRTLHARRALRLSRRFAPLRFCTIPAPFLPHFFAFDFHNNHRINDLRIPAFPHGAILLHITS